MSVRPRLDAEREFFDEVPPVPLQIRYYDDFSDSYGEVRDAASTQQWAVSFNGSTATFDFSKFDIQIRQLIMSWCSTVLSQLSPVTAQYYYYALSRLTTDQICSIVSTGPREIRKLWGELHAADLPAPVFVSLHSLLDFCCEYSIADWGPEWTTFLSQLPLRRRDKYASVRTGEAFLDAEEERTLVLHLDHVCAVILTDRAAVSDDDLKSTAALACSYQFGLRTKQIAMLKMKDIRLWQDNVDEGPAVHLTFLMIKQRSGRAFPLVRKIKREWTPIFIELLRRAHLRELHPTDHILAANVEKLGSMLTRLTAKLLGESRTTTELRHTAAQRLVDAGANEEELASFLGQTDLNTGLMYFRSSRSQAERVNSALGISTIYRRVAKIAHDRFISEAELHELRGEQQVAGVPHGMPIAGIGGCSTGQPNCPFNPVLSCYGCNKFMPISDEKVHERVLGDLREIVKVAYWASRGDRGSPALQMEKTIANIQTVIDELRSDGNELLL